MFPNGPLLAEQIERLIEHRKFGVGVIAHDLETESPERIVCLTEETVETYARPLKSTGTDQAIFLELPQILEAKKFDK